MPSRKFNRDGFAIAVVCAAILTAGAATGQDAPEGRGPKHYPAEMNKKFTDPNADIQQFVKRFEDEGRDVYVQRGAIVRAVGLRPGDAVADIGAGTGLFTFLFADRVLKGTVYAVDIGPAFVKYIGDQTKRRGQEEVVKTVLNTPDSVELPAGSINVAFLCDTYHHFEHPARMLASIHRALRPGGRLVVIDFDLRKDSGEFVKKRARAPKEVYYREIAAVGFEPIETKDTPRIKDNFYAEFRRVERGPESQPIPSSPAPHKP
jgi:ubiquinone/menaquinone biosynthesis C-methylase UbiE